MMEFASIAQRSQPSWSQAYEADRPNDRLHRPGDRGSAAGLAVSRIAVMLRGKPCGDRTGDAPDASCDNGIMPPICPTRQDKFGKGASHPAGRHPLLCMGLFSMF
ncbi:hypothetical protein [Bradyrhizobium liaoningense]|uniref:hypothetical protein n=1 Tax=Bradyrhizobium liaoningense TaxID=43992 RepID=UPI001BA938DE|nr:hypothetical protein [Bradyrhizobium liaoningense]MBR0712806.1 hypothetical protein [Bradyrhizobium liaoningense]